MKYRCSDVWWHLATDVCSSPANIILCMLKSVGIIILRPLVITLNRRSNSLLVIYHFSVTVCCILLLYLAVVQNVLQQGQHPGQQRETYRSSFPRQECICRRNELLSVGDLWACKHVLLLHRARIYHKLDHSTSIRCELSADDFKKALWIRASTVTTMKWTEKVFVICWYVTVSTIMLWPAAVVGAPRSGQFGRIFGNIQVADSPQARTFFNMLMSCLVFITRKK